MRLKAFYNLTLGQKNAVKLQAEFNNEDYV